MQLEIEIKAWVDDPAALHDRLLSRGSAFLRDYRKEDHYFRSKLSGQNLDIRIRSDEQEKIVTYKDKILEDGVELNREYEFTVSNAEPIRELLVRLGAQPLVTKVKIGQAYRYGELLVEVSEVVGLGTFVEIEAVIQVEREDQVPTASQGAKSKVERALGELGIGRDRIEERSYTALLLKTQGPR